MESSTSKRSPRGRNLSHLQRRSRKKGNLIVLHEDGGESYIYIKATKKSIPIHQENNVYVLDVDFMTEVDDSSKSVEVPFRRPE